MLARRFIPSLILAGVITWLSVNQQPIPATIILLIVCGRNWLKSRSDDAVGWKTITPQLIGGISIIIIISLHTNIVVQAVLGIIFWLWWAWLAKASTKRQVLVVAAGNQLLLSTAVFLAASLWSWSAGIVVGVMWAGSFLIADQIFEASNERARLAMSASWALVVAELSWVFELWQVNYIFPGGWLAIPQAAIVIMALGYSLGSIYIAHLESHLSRRRLAEYLVIATVVIAIVLSGTKWSGVI